MWDSSSFITLTYSEENKPENGSLNVKHFQDFMKRLRKKLKKKLATFTVANMAKNWLVLTIMPLFMVMIFQIAHCGNKNLSPYSHPLSLMSPGVMVSRQ